MGSDHGQGWTVHPREFTHTFLDTRDLIWSNFLRRIV